MNETSDGKTRKPQAPQFFGVATVGDRGQIVIPVDARKAYAIETGDKLLIMGTPGEKGLWIGKIEDIRAFHGIMTMFLNTLDDIDRKPEDQNIND